MSKVEASKVQAVEYGIVASATRVKRFLDLNMELNSLAREAGKHGRVPFIWGPKGIGKTVTVRDWCLQRGYEWREVPLAQFEEMGDINGFPIVVEEEGRKVTRTAPPDWVPAQPAEKGGILFFDDANRAEPRIQRGLMQLYQTYGMVSWKIPPGWMIVCTGNPEDGDYDVSAMDEAQVTRLTHVRMIPNVKAWAEWAECNNVHPIGINYLIRHPETLETPGQRTCPRTLVEFFDSLGLLGGTTEALKARLEDVELMGNGSLDSETITQFITFLSSDSDKVLEPEFILSKPKETLKHLKTLYGAGKDAGCKYYDVMNVMATRLTNHLMKEGVSKDLKKDQKTAFLSFLQSGLTPKGLPKDHVYLIIKTINDSGDRHLIDIWSDSDELVEMISDGIEDDI